MRTPRISPGGLRDLGPINWVICRVVAKATGTPDAQLFSTLGRTRGLFLGWLHYSGRLMPGGELARLDTELVILRIAQLRDCAYEWDHHLRLGRRVGITPELRHRLREGPTAQGWTDAQRALLSAVDALVETKTVDDETWTRLAAHYRPRLLVEFVLLTTQYDGLATTINTLGIQRDTFTAKQ